MGIRQISYEDKRNISPQMMYMLGQLALDYGYNTTRAYNTDGSSSGVVQYNDFTHPEIFSVIQNIHAGTNCVISMEGTNEYKKNPKLKSSIAMYADAIKTIGQSFEIFSEDTGFKWMTGFVNPDLNIAFSYLKGAMVDAGSTQLPTSIPGQQIPDGSQFDINDEIATLLYASSLMYKDYQIPTMNPIALGVLQALITELPAHFIATEAQNLAFKTHSHMPFVAMVEATVKRAFMSMSDDGTVKVKTSSVPLYYVGPRVNIPGVTDRKSDASVDGDKSKGPFKLENPIFISDGLARVGGKLLFKKPQSDYFSSIPGVIKNNIGKFLGGGKTTTMSGGPDVSSPGTEALA